MPKKQFCGEPVRDGLMAIGRWPMRYLPTPGDFSEEERFTMFKRVMHENVWPVSDIIEFDGRIAYVWTYSAWGWLHGGHRAFAKRIRDAAQAEIAAVNYSVYDLRPIRQLIGDDGPRFCRLLQATDAAEMEQRMNGMEADLAVMRGGKGGWLWTMLAP